MVCDITVSAGLSVLAFLEGLNMKAARGSKQYTGSCSHLRVFCSFGVSCSHCNPRNLQRATDGVSFVPTLAVLLHKDTTIFMGNRPVSRTGPETSLQAQKCWCIPTGTGIVWVVAVLLSYTKCLYWLIGTHLICKCCPAGEVEVWQQQKCPQQ